MSVQEEIIGVLSPIFGSEIGKVIERYYQEGEYEEMAHAAEHMLAGYLGPEKGRAKIRSIMAKYELKKK